ncbi:MAG: hypothetical protein HY286_15665 [Planctomycetes bacterium]|nr:hypothetical protein [Planctomycetota bacterium]
MGIQSKNSRRNVQFSTLCAAALPAAIFAVGLLAIAGCKAAPPKDFLHSEWTEFESVNPTDIVVLPVQGSEISMDVHLDDVRETAQLQLRNHRYSTLDSNFIDAGSPVAPVAVNAGLTTTHGDSAGPGFGAVAKLQIVIKEFDHLRYEISRSMHVVGEFRFHQVGTDKLLASVNSDQFIDLSDAERRGSTKDEVIRLATSRFIERSLRLMPDRRIDSKGAISEKPAESK